MACYYLCTRRLLVFFITELLNSGRRHCNSPSYNSLTQVVPTIILRISIRYGIGVVLFSGTAVLLNQPSASANADIHDASMTLW